MWQTTANDIQSFSTWNSYHRWQTTANEHKHLWHETVVHMWQTTANDTQTCLPWNSYPSVANNSKWHRSIFDMKQLSICNKQQQMTHKHVWHETAIHMWQTTANDTRAFLTWKSYPYVATTAKDIQSCLTWNSYPYVANNSKWHTSMFHMKQLSICGKQQQMTHKHVCHETVIHLWQTTANDTQAFLTWNSCPYVANNSKWHTSMFDMKQLSICGKQQQMTHKHVWHETVIHCGKQQQMNTSMFDSYPYVANNSKWHTIMFDMKQLSICGKQQQMTHKHFWHETVVHMWQTTANDIPACWTWNSYPYVAYNSKWHTIIFDMKQLSICGKQQQMTHKHVSHETVIHMWQTTANDTQTCLPWNSYPSVANNSKWHTSIFDMKQLSICGKQQHMTHKNFWHETVIHVLFIYLFKIYFTFLISQAVKLTIYTGRKTKIFTYNIRK